MIFGEYFWEQVSGTKITYKHSKKFERKKCQTVATITQSLITMMLNAILHRIVVTRPLA